MNRAKLIETLTDKVNQQINKDDQKINKKQVDIILDTLTQVITAELKHDREVTLTGFGTFSSMTRYARGGVNPRKPDERITIPAVKVAKFRTGKNLKEALKS
jgi:DNA-binding protein HU-beta